MDRIDIHIEVPFVDYKTISSTTPTESSESIRKRIDQAREEQRERYGRREDVNNATMSARDVCTYCKLDASSQDLLQDAFEKLRLSARAHDRILKVARTIDLERKEMIQVQHIAEAIQYRTLDRKLLYDPNM